eukprot:1298870-Ditylum_brightwellii.AAC.1
MGNEVSKALQKTITNKQITLQLAPPHIYHHNAAKRAIQTFKHHFIAGLCNVHPEFPLQLWNRLIYQACLTLNMLRLSRLNARISAETQLNGMHDFNCLPLAPPGTEVIVHEKSSVRGTWAPLGIDG